MDITEKIHNAIEWANKRLTLQGQELSQEQKNYITFALSQNFTDNNQALQLQQTGVSGRSEQLVSFLQWYIKDDMIREKKELIKSVVERYLKETNCH